MVLFLVLDVIVYRAEVALIVCKAAVACLP